MATGIVHGSAINKWTSVATGALCDGSGLPKHCSASCADTGSFCSYACESRGAGNGKTAGIPHIEMERGGRAPGSRTHLSPNGPSERSHSGIRKEFAAVERVD